MGLHSRYARILADGERPSFLGGRKEEEDKIRQKLSKMFDGMMNHLHKEQGASLRIEILGDDEVQSFINAHAEVLNGSMRQAEMSDAMRSRLEKSNYIFSGMKTFHELNEAFPSLTRADGSRKPFEEFLHDVRKIDDTYNGNYLRSEYNFVQASADMAARWESFSDDDRYELQYRTAGDDRVRPEHAALDGITLPKSDSFWNGCMPPNSWNCRCQVVQVRRGKYPTTPHSDAMQRGDKALAKDTKGMFRFNSGKQAKSVPDYNPYTIKRCNSCDVAKGKATLNNAKGIGRSELCKACLFIRECRTDAYNNIQHKRARNYVTNTIPSNGYMLNKVNGSDFKMNVNRKALRAVIKHFPLENKMLIKDIIKALPKRKYESYSPLGDTKDMNNPKDVANIRKKKERGVSGYNLYDLRINEKDYVLFAEIKYGKEYPYAVYTKKRNNK